MLLIKLQIEYFFKSHNNKMEMEKEESKILSLKVIKQTKFSPFAIHITSTRHSSDDILYSLNE